MKKFDPKLQVSIFNVPPQSWWPIKKGTKVYFIEKDNISEGVVTFYNPARKEDDVCWLVTAGHAYYAMDTKFGNRVSMVDRTLPKSRKNYAKLMMIIADDWEKASDRRAADAARQALEALNMSNTAAEIRLKYWSKRKQKSK